MQYILIQTALILILILINAYFALSELAVLSAKKLHLQEKANQGSEHARKTLDLVGESTTFLSNVQIGITLVGVASGTIGGATIASSFTEYIKLFPMVGKFADSISITLVILTITILSLIIGELVPKRIAISNPERFALMVAPSIDFISRVFSPISKFVSGTTDVFIRLIGIDTSDKPDISLDELRLMIDAGASSGVLAPIEEMMLEQVLRFNNIRIETLLTPRQNVNWLNVNATQEEIKEFLKLSNFEKIPVADGDLDNILGVVYIQKLFSDYLQYSKFNLKEALSPPVLVPESITLLQTLEYMRKNQTNIVFVLNEYGGIDGLVSTKDILEAITGDMPEIDEHYDPQIVQLPDGSWLLDGMLMIEVFSDLIKVDLDQIKQNQVMTLAGFVLNQLKKIPQTGDGFQAFGYDFQVVDMDNNRIDKILIKEILHQP